MRDHAEPDDPKEARLNLTDPGDRYELTERIQYIFRLARIVDATISQAFIIMFPNGEKEEVNVEDLDMGSQVTYGLHDQVLVIYEYHETTKKTCRRIRLLSPQEIIKGLIETGIR